MYAIRKCVSAKKSLVAVLGVVFFLFLSRSYSQRDGSTVPTAGRSLKRSHQRNNRQRRRAKSNMPTAFMKSLKPVLDHSPNKKTGPQRNICPPLVSSFTSSDFSWVNVNFVVKPSLHPTNKSYVQYVHIRERGCIGQWNILCKSPPGSLVGQSSLKLHEWSRNHILFIRWRDSFVWCWSAGWIDCIFVCFVCFVATCIWGLQH